ncbi:MAG: hypothetical protein HQ567_04840 [Candidatus Nealsonbacteria bacterium]|nr:hypothetical protein [Candidatus Nealsonbacteria bacterium]
MSARILLSGLVILLAADLATAQPAADDSTGDVTPMWRPAGEAHTQPPAGGRGDLLPPATDPPPRSSARVSSGPDTLPNKHGQVWREYDISPYTTRVTSTKRPELAIIDWILRKTGYEVWHGEPLGILSATDRKLRVYHTPEMQAVVADMVERFVRSEAQTSKFSLRVVTVDHPNWRSRAQRVLHSMPVQTPGVSAWLLQKEDAAILLAAIRRRSDFREHSSPHLLVNNGQATVVSSMRGRSYVRDAAIRRDVWPGFQTETAEVDEGYMLEFSPLLTADGRIIDAAIKCHVDQVEKMIPVTMEVPTAADPRQRTKIEVPQTTHFRFHERFQWPVDQVLLISMGMVASPTSGEAKPLVPGLPLALGSTPPRSDLLVFVENKGKASDPQSATGAPLREAKNYHGRY